MRQVRTGTSDRFAPCRSTRKIEWMPAVHNLGTPEINKKLACIFMTTHPFCFPKAKLSFGPKTFSFLIFMWLLNGILFSANPGATNMGHLGTFISLLIFRIPYIVIIFPGNISFVLTSLAASILTSVCSAVCNCSVTS